MILHSNALFQNLGLKFVDLQKEHGIPLLEDNGFDPILFSLK